MKRETQYDPIEFAKRTSYVEGLKKGLSIGLLITVIFSGLLVLVLLLASCASVKPSKPEPPKNVLPKIPSDIWN